MNRQHYPLLLLLGASFLLSLAYCPPFQLVVDDKEIFSYAGMAIAKGLVPYKDFFDHKPPVIFFINFAGYVLGGGSPWGLWIINTGLALGGTWWFFKCCRRYRVALPWLLPLLFNLLIRDNLISQGINMTREFTAFFTLFFFCVLMGRSRHRYFLLGLLSTLTFFTQQDQLIPQLPLLIYALLAADEVPTGGRLLRLSAGALTILIPLLGFFAFHHALSHFWEDAFKFNFTTYITAHKSLGDHFRTIKHVLDDGNYELPFMVAVVLGITALFGQNSRKGLVIAAMAALLLTLIPEFMGGRLDIEGQPSELVYYFLPLSTGICIVLFTVFAFTEDRILSGRLAQAPYAALLCCSLLYTALQHGTHLVRRDQDYVIQSPELAYLERQNVTDHQLYVFCDNPYIYCYNHFRVLAPSRWIYHHFYAHFPSWDPDQKILKSIANDLIWRHTTYVIMDTRLMAQFRHPGNRDWWLAFMHSYYQPVMLNDKPSLLWKRKD
ncbi:MAG TPA: hypothetical protein VI233_06890 [Puia sp.]